MKESLSYELDGFIFSHEHKGSHLVLPAQTSFGNKTWSLKIDRYAVDGEHNGSRSWPDNSDINRRMIYVIPN